MDARMRRIEDAARLAMADLAAWDEPAVRGSAFLPKAAMVLAGVGGAVLAVSFFAI